MREGSRRPPQRLVSRDPGQTARGHEGLEAPWRLSGNPSTVLSGPTPARVGHSDPEEHTGWAERQDTNVTEASEPECEACKSQAATVRMNHRVAGRGQGDAF